MGEMPGCLDGDDSTRQIAFISYQHNLNIWVGMLPDLLKPEGSIAEGILLRHVVNDDGSLGITIVAE